MSRWGNILVEAARPSLAHGGQCIDDSTYVWRPSDELAAYLPAGFTVEMGCFTLDGTRIFRPVAGMHAFALQASLAGAAILELLGKLDEEHRFTYRIMRSVYQQAPRFVEHLDRALTRPEDLLVSRRGRMTADQRDTLPEDIGLDIEGKGSRWSVSQVLARGREAARIEPRQRASGPQVLRLGLAEAAKRNPLPAAKVSEAEALAVVRLVLFDLGPHPDHVETDLKDRVVNRFLGCVEKHADMDSEKFMSWLSDLDNIVHSVSKQVKGGGQIDRELVRQVLLETVFDAHRYVGQTASLFTQAFRQALSEPLADRERHVFDTFYAMQPWLGGMPLFVLHERFEFLQDAIGAVWQNPGDMEAVGTLLRLMDFYGAITRSRRAADRKRKAAGHVREQVCAPEFIDDLASEQETSKPSEIFQRVAALLRQQRGAECDCATTAEWVATVVEVENGIATISDRCSRCKHEVTFGCQVEDLKGLAEDL